MASGESERSVFFALGVLFDRRGDHNNVSLAGNIFHGALYGTGELVGGVKEDKSNGVGESIRASEISGDEVGPVVQDLGRSTHLLGQDSVYRGLIVNDSRCGLNGDPGE